MGTVGTRELEEMGIAERVLEEYEERDEFQDVAEYTSQGWFYVWLSLSMSPL